MSSGKAHSDCQRLVALLTEYVENELSAAMKSELERHLDCCPPCLAFLDQYRDASVTCREALLKQVPDDLETRLMSYLRVRCGEPGCCDDGLAPSFGDLPIKR
jgi:anti-sigma factor RsiW